jgi:ATP-dependent exoDNAse (exonuclease V) beta subunit
MSSLETKSLPYPHVCVVEASAGSGKTYALARRYLELLISPRLVFAEVPLKNILAITFSNKATLEMKARILDFLKKMALDKFCEPDQKELIIAGLGVDAAHARQKAHAIMDILVKNYNFFQVQTIDSFINAILSGCAYKLGLSSVFRIKTDYKEPLSLSLDRLIDRAADDKQIAGLFKKFLAQYLFLEDKTSWFPRQDILKMMGALFFESNIRGVPFYRSRLEARDAVALKKKILREIRTLLEGLPVGTHATFEKSLRSFLEKDRQGFDVAELSDYFSREDFPITKKGKADLKVDKLWQDIREHLRELCEAESVLVFNPYIDIFDFVVKDFRALARKDDVLFLEELNLQARRLFDEEGVTVPELYYRLSSRLRHFLIDEFQDTSRLQWQNLYPMVLEALSTGGSVFYVGDKKQAIYRFRGGEVALFDAVPQTLVSFDVIKRSLGCNYRSAGVLVAFCNDCFSGPNLRRFLLEKNEVAKKGVVFNAAEEEEVLKVFENAAQEAIAGHEGGYCRLESLQGDTREERDVDAKAKILGLIRDLSGRFAYRDIAVLARENDEVELLTGWLVENHIPVESEKTLNIRNNALVKELVSFLSFLHSPIDDLSFASFILGEIFAKACGKETREFRDFVFEVGQKRTKEKSVTLYREFRAHFASSWEALVDEFFKSVGFVPLYELVVSIYKTFAVFENFPGHQGFFMKFLEVVKSQEQERPGLALFLEYFRNAPDAELYVHVADTDSVRILTIHKAKGLGFPVVILPFLEMNVRVNARVTSPEGGVLVLRRISEKTRSFSPDLDAIYRKEYLKAFIDELNALYVGLTRSQEELYLYIAPKAKKGVNLAGLLIAGGSREIGAKKTSGKKTAQEKPGVSAIPLSRYQDWIEVLREEFVAPGFLANREKRHQGEALHCILSEIGGLTPQDAEEVLARACQKARCRFPFIRNWEKLDSRIASVIAAKKLRPFFFVEDASVKREKEVVDRSGHTRRIDRLIVHPEEVWVVDFKSSSQEKDEGRRQVQEYLGLMARLYPGKAVKGFLVYLDNASLEEVHE